MTKVKLNNKSAVIFDGHQIPSLSQVLSIGNDGGGLQIKNIADPTNNQDAITLAYFNAHNTSGSIVSVSGTPNQITANTVSGAVTLSLPNSVVFPGTWSIGTLGYSDTGIFWSAQSSTNSYNQVIIQNSSNGSAASSNFLVSNDLGTATTHYLEMGKNSSGFSNGAGSFNLANASYLDDASDDLVIGTLSNKTLHFVTNNSATDNLSITGAGVMTFNGSSTAIHKEIFNNLGTTQTDGAGIWLQNSTAATNGNQQISPLFTWEGQGFATTPVASQVVRFGADVLPVQAAINPSATWRLRWSINGSSYADALTINQIIGSSATMTLSSAAFGALTFQTNLISTNQTTLTFQTQSTNRLVINTGGGITHTQAPVGGGASTFVSTPGAHTGIASNTEIVSRDFQGATQAWNDGIVSTQRFNYFKGYIVNKTVSSTTFTDIFTVSIDQTTAGAGVTLTNNWALGINGNMKIFDGFNIGFGTTTGTIIGISTTQKLSFWGKTPIVQPTTAISAATRVGGGGTTITDTDTFGGYTLAKLAAVIINSGLAA